MEGKNQSKGMNRRGFIQKSSAAAASALILPYAGSGLMGAQSISLSDVTIPNTELNNGLAMPMLGFGTFTLRGETGVTCVAQGIELGYRLFDTATIYGNETEVGKGIKESGIDRKELFITSKVWVDDSGYEQCKKAFETSLEKLGTDYLDLYLIHRPRGDVKGSWQAMEELYEAGRIKAIGISNFEPVQYDALMSYAKVKPAVNQIETHAFFQQRESYPYMEEHGVQTEAWSPFAQGRNGMFNNKSLAAIGSKYNKTNAQVCLRWHYQRGIVAIPRTVQKAHMQENLKIFDFELSPEDMKSIEGLDLNRTQFPEWG